MEALLGDEPRLKNILIYHVVAGTAMAAEVAHMSSANTALGRPITINAQNGQVMLNDARVTATDIQASNGVIHVIDSVLLPK